MTRLISYFRPRTYRFDTRPLILAAMAGAVFEYFWDPYAGRRRRTMMRDQFRSTVLYGLRRLGRIERFAEGQAYGRVEETIRLHQPDNPNPDDATLRDRVESELFRDWEVPKGSININVAGGIVEIRGQVALPEAIDEIEEKVRRIEGVHTIHNYLHLPDTPAPNKARVLSVF